MPNTWIELDLRILRENLRNLRAALRPATEILFVVKSDAYGHGLLPVSRCAWECGVRFFAVVHVEEAASLRESLPQARILFLGVLCPRDVETAARLRLEPLVVSREHAEALRAEAKAHNAVLRCHAKVDTGMGRLGFPWETAGAALRDLAAGREVTLAGVCTHLASAGDPASGFAETQAARFFGVLDDCAKHGLTFPCRHMSNSAGILRNPDWDLDAVRPGILLYGYAKDLAGRRAVATQPFLQWKTRVLQVKKVPRGFPVSYDSTFVTDRETLLGTLDVGYADGYLRALSNRGQVLVAGRRCPVAGRVTMDLITVDLGPESPARAGDEAVLIGSQGTEKIGADDLAARAGTISYEILTGIRTPDRRIAVS